MCFLIKDHFPFRESWEPRRTDRVRTCICADVIPKINVTPYLKIYITKEARAAQESQLPFNETRLFPTVSLLYQLYKTLFYVFSVLKFPLFKEGAFLGWECLEFQ